jgi:hypothetical protein
VYASLQSLDNAFEQVTIGPVRLKNGRALRHEILPAMLATEAEAVSGLLRSNSYAKNKLSSRLICLCVLSSIQPSWKTCFRQNVILDERRGFRLK